MHIVNRSNALGLVAPLGLSSLAYHDPVYSDDPGAPQGVPVLASDDNTGVLVLAALVLFVVLSQ